jgi:hypothetical protein
MYSHLELHVHVNTPARSVVKRAHCMSTMWRKTRNSNGNDQAGILHPSLTVLAVYRSHLSAMWLRNYLPSSNDFRAKECKEGNMQRKITPQCPFRCPHRRAPGRMAHYWDSTWCVPLIEGFSESIENWKDLPPQAQTNLQVSKTQPPHTYPTGIRTVGTGGCPPTIFTHRVTVYG